MSTSTYELTSSVELLNEFERMELQFVSQYRECFHVECDMSPNRTTNSCLFRVLELCEDDSQ